MTTGQKGIDLIKSFEGWFPKPYLDPIGIPTIGWGSITYPNGNKVTMQDPAINQQQGEQFLRHELEKYERQVSAMVKKPINQNQFDALLSFTYNLGPVALSKSTLLKKVNINPYDPTIRGEFQKWVNAGNKKLPGLVRRRGAEANLYFSK